MIEFHTSGTRCLKKGWLMTTCRKDVVLTMTRSTFEGGGAACVKQKDEGVPNKLIRTTSLVDSHGVERALNSES